jgi:hypothetical protein
MYKFNERLDPRGKLNQRIKPHSANSWSNFQRHPLRRRVDSNFDNPRPSSGSEKHRVQFHKATTPGELQSVSSLTSVDPGSSH